MRLTGPATTPPQVPSRSTWLSPLLPSPDATCNNVVGLPPLRPYRGAYWVGIGGMNDPGDPDARLNGGKVSLEQTGVEMYCARRYATPEFALFWEIVPDASPKYDGVNLGWPGVNHVVDVHPGNTVSMEVDSPGWVDISGHAGQYRMTITSTRAVITPAPTPSGAASSAVLSLAIPSKRSPSGRPAPRPPRAPGR